MTPIKISVGLAVGLMVLVSTCWAAPVNLPASLTRMVRQAVADENCTNYPYSDSYKIGMGLSKDLSWFYLTRKVFKMQGFVQPGLPVWLQAMCTFRNGTRNTAILSHSVEDLSVVQSADAVKGYLCNGLSTFITDSTYQPNCTDEQATQDTFDEVCDVFDLYEFIGDTVTYHKTEYENWICERGLQNDELLIEYSIRRYNLDCPTPPSNPRGAEETTPPPRGRTTSGGSTTSQRGRRSTTEGLKPLSTGFTTDVPLDSVSSPDPDLIGGMDF